jgi:hypothetical protein
MIGAAIASTARCPIAGAPVAPMRRAPLTAAGVQRRCRPWAIEGDA